MKQTFEVSGERIVRHDGINAAVKELVEAGHAYFHDKSIEKFDSSPAAAFAKSDNSGPGGTALYVVKYWASGSFNVDVPAGTKAIRIEL